MTRALIYSLMFLMGFLVMVATPTAYSTAYAATVGTGNPEGSPAAGQPQTVDENGTIKKCSDVPEARGGVLLGVLVPCITYTIEKSTMKFTAGMIDWLKPLFYTFLTLVVTLFGVRMLQQEPNLEKQGILLLLKIALVVLILESMPTYIVPKVYEVMNESQSIVLGAIGNTQLSCDVAKYSGSATPPVWATMDCVMGKLFGFTTGTATNSAGVKSPNMLLATSMFGLMTGFLFGGAWGVVVFFGMLGVLITMFMLVIRTAMAFIMGYLIVCVMLILSPLLMPLIFMRTTQNYFEAVSKNILAGLVMPVIVASYAMFALVLYDKMLFAPDSLIQKIFQYDEIKDALQASRAPCDRQVTGDPSSLRTATPGDQLQLNALLKNNPFLLNNVMPQLSGGNNACAGVKIPTLNMNDAKSDEFKKGKATYEKLFYDLMTLFILAYLIYLGLDALEDIALQLTGASTVALGFNSKQIPMSLVPGEGRMENMADTVKQQMQGYKDVRGAEFLKRAPIDAREGIDKFFKGIMKK